MMDRKHLKLMKKLIGVLAVFIGFTCLADVSLPNKIQSTYFDVGTRKPGYETSHKSFTQAIKNGYNFFTACFMKVDGEKASFTPPYPEFATDVLEAKKDGIITILSTGGQFETFLAEGNLNNIAASIVECIKQYNCQGIDFDLEGDISTYKIDINALAKKIKAIDDTLIISIAPQLVYDQSLGWRLVTTGWCQEPYATMIKDKSVDVIFVQCYNNTWMTCPGVITENQVEFIPLALKALGNDALTNNIPIILGEPACKDAGNSFFNDKQYKTDKDALNAFKNVLSNLSPELKHICRGVGNWSTSWDYSNDFQFAQIVFPVFTENI
jgi:chitinase